MPLDDQGRVYHLGCRHGDGIFIPLGLPVLMVWMGGWGSRQSRGQRRGPSPRGSARDLFG